MVVVVPTVRRSNLTAMGTSHMVKSEMRVDDNFMNIFTMNSNEICIRYNQSQAHPINLFLFCMMKI